MSLNHIKISLTKKVSYKMDSPAKLFLEFDPLLVAGPFKKPGVTSGATIVISDASGKNMNFFFM